MHIALKFGWQLSSRAFMDFDVREGPLNLITGSLAAEMPAKFQSDFDDSKHLSISLKSFWDLTVRHLMQYWNDPLGIVSF